MDPRCDAFLGLYCLLTGIPSKNEIKTSSPKGNHRSPGSQQVIKIFEQFSSKRLLNWSRAANSAVHGCIRLNFKLIRDFIVVLVTCKNEEDPMKNEGARVLT